jgi:acyl-CoA synthetase (AMP-forming)/AMP-acid ligase II
MIQPRQGDTAPVPERTVTQTVLGTRPRGDRPALVDATSGRTTSYADMTSAIWSAAAGLRGNGIGRGDVIGVQLPDVPELAIALQAVMAAGAVPVPIRPTTPADVMTDQLIESGARMLITWPVLLDIALDAVKSTPVERVMCFGQEPDVEPFSALLTGDGRPVEVELDPRTDLALLPYSRGTTGPSRGIRLTHRNLVASVTQFAGAGLISEADTLLSAVPLTDVIGLTTVLLPGLQAGAMIVTRSGTGRLDLLRTLQDRAVTVVVLPPDMVEVLAYDRSVERYNLRQLRSIISTGGPLRPEVARACATRLRCTVRQAYGLAEAAGVTHVNLRAAEEGTLDSVGRGLPWVDWRIVDPAGGAGRIPPPGPSGPPPAQPSYQQGELLVRGPMVTRAYADAEPLPEWVPTGDAAFADDHGRLYIMGRMAGPGPEPPDEPEAMLETHPAVQDAAVVPIPHADLGLAPHAFAVLREPVSAADLLAYVNSHLPPYQQVQAVHVVPVIPRTPSGRILRRALIDRAGLADGPEATE